MQVLEIAREWQVHKSIIILVVLHVNPSSMGQGQNDRTSKIEELL